MKKKVFALLLLVTGTWTMGMETFAAEDTGTIVFEGGAEQFAETQGDFTSFERMMPGETRTQTIVLHNEDKDEVDFFLSGEVVENIADSVQEGARGVYTIDLLRDGETFYTGMIGNGEEIGEEFLQDDYLVASLEKGEQTTLELVVGLDGDSMTDEYQLADGQIDLTITSQYAEQPTPNVVTNYVTRWVNETVKTGDVAAVLPYIIGLAAVAGLLIILIVYKKKQSKGEEHEE